MAFSINTNVASLQAQNYLLQSSNFQAQTINHVTSGLRIVNSGDDAAGLAVANGMQSDQAVLTQGIQNANNGLATMQTIDAGMSNINTLLDRAQTLATESASGTFSGSRSTLNTEFQSVLGEINRQAQSIGLNQGGQFAKALSVYIGGGKGSTAAASTADGTINVDLSKSSVDATSLGLSGFAAGYKVAAGATDTGLYDLGNSSTTSVNAIVGNATNQASEATAGYTQFTISGAGFSDANAINITVNMAGVSDTASLVSAINAGISAAAQGGSAPDNAFAKAGISASIHTGTDGHQQLVFTSSSNAFTVAAGDKTANALMGNLTGQTNGGDANATSAVGTALSNASNFNGGGAAQLSVNYGNTAGLVKATPEKQALTFTSYDASGTPSSTTVTLDATTAAGANLTAAEAAAQVNAQLQTTDIASLQSIVAVASQDGTGINFETNGSRFDMSIGVATGGDGVTTASGNNQGVIQTGQVTGVGANADISTIAGATSAINALTAAVQTFGTAQAAVGRGENNLNYAINLAQSQSTNEAAAESTIKDANLAQEAANLSKAQILVQAGTAALAQANSAPQQLLALLQH
ncbi:MAG TPA: flagellin [Bryobacteraceae bacterium]|jgi:flagellin|nr:flagellin [Bryobacteraceae bacterium]